MIRISLFLSGKLKMPLLGTLVVLIAVIADATLRQGYLPLPFGVSEKLVSALLYLGIIVASVRLLGSRKIEVHPQPETSDMGVVGILLFSIFLVVIAVFIPGSQYMDEMCQSSERFCGIRKFAFEIALRLLGIFSVLDYLDVRQLKRRGFF